MPAAARAVAAAPTGRHVERLNAFNVALMLAAAAAAWLAPFELLLAAYAILGPLHYLTELSWLHDRGYFTTRRLDAVPLLALAACAVLERTGVLHWSGAVVLAFGAAGVFAFVRDARRRALLLAAVVAASLALQQWTAAWWFLVVMLPTVIHVFLFTGLFILHGSLRARSPWGYASLAVFLLCGLGLLLYRPPAAAYAVSPRVAALGDEFGLVFDQLALLTGGEGWDTLVAFGRFLAFAYTYHYLNWFSKTGVIRWHTIGRARLGIIAAVYAAALGLYAYDYGVGIVALFALSIAHVLLEFPLDLRTLAGLAVRAPSGAA